MTEKMVSSYRSLMREGMSPKVKAFLYVAHNPGSTVGMLQAVLGYTGSQVVSIAHSLVDEGLFSVSGDVGEEEEFELSDPARNLGMVV